MKGRWDGAGGVERQDISWEMLGPENRLLSRQHKRYPATLCWTLTEVLAIWRKADYLISSGSQWKAAKAVRRGGKGS